MSIERTIRERRSIHTFKKEPIPREVVLELLDAAVWAPNHQLREPWRFIYADGEGKERLINGLTAIYESNEEFAGLTHKQIKKFIKGLIDVPSYMIFVMKVESGSVERDEDYAAVCCLIQNFQLLGWEKNIGMLWCSGEFLDNQGFRELVGVHTEERIVAVLSLGYFDKIPKAQQRTSVHSKITYL